MKIIKQSKAKKRLRQSLNAYQLYEAEKKNPDPKITYEVWVKNLARELKI